MTQKLTGPAFLDRRAYRLRRMRDAVRLLPLAGVGLLLMPLLWPSGPAEAGEAITTSGALLYIFGVWLALIGASLLLWFVLRGVPERPE